MEKVKKQWSEAQVTLEELGIQLSVSKLKINDLQEKVNTNDMNSSRQMGATGEIGSGVWTPDKLITKCKGCHRDFNLTRRKVNTVIFIIPCEYCIMIYVLFLASLQELWRYIL